MHAPTYTTFSHIKDDMTTLIMREVVPVVDAYGEIADSPAEIDTDRVERTAERIYDEIDSRIGRVYDVPLSEVPGIIERIARKLIICELYHGENEIPRYMQEACQLAREDLEKISSGKLDIGLPRKANGGGFIVKPYDHTGRGNYGKSEITPGLFSDILNHENKTET